MPGMNRFTGKSLDDWPHLLQSLRVLFTTRLGLRVMRRTYGSAIPGLLGNRMTERTLIAFTAAVAIACYLWEKRFVLETLSAPADINSPDRMRSGRIGLRLTGLYRPRALRGDLTVADTRSFDL